MLNKRVFIICALMLTTTLIYQVNSYTEAKVTNSADISITETDEALIAVTSNTGLDFERITEISPFVIQRDSGDETGENTKIYINKNSFDLKIQNNMNNCIKELYVDLIGQPEGISLKNNNISHLGSGRDYDCFYFVIDENIKDVPKKLDIKITAKWDEGSAIIYDKIPVMFNENKNYNKTNIINEKTIKENLEGSEELENPENNDNPDSNENLGARREHGTGNIEGPEQVEKQENSENNTNTISTSEDITESNNDEQTNKDSIQQEFSDTEDSNQDTVGKQSSNTSETNITTTNNYSSVGNEDVSTSDDDSILNSVNTD